MKRSAFSQLVTWKDNPERKPLIIRGARQVGKTWLMKEFGQSCYDSFVYFNFDEEDELKSIFEANKNPQRIIELLSMIAGEKILPGETLVIFDEVQECPEALNTLKYLKRKRTSTMLLQPEACLAPFWPSRSPTRWGWSIFSIYTPFILMSFWKPPTRRSLPIIKASRRIRPLRKFSTTACWKPTTTI